MKVDWEKHFPTFRSGARRIALAAKKLKPALATIKAAGDSIELLGESVAQFPPQALFRTALVAGSLLGASGNTINVEEQAALGYGDRNAICQCDIWGLKENSCGAQKRIDHSLLSAKYLLVAQNKKRQLACSLVTQDKIESLS